LSTQPEENRKTIESLRRKGARLDNLTEQNTQKTIKLLDRKVGILNHSRDAGTSIHDNSPNPDIQAIRRPHRTSLRSSTEG